MSIEEAFRLAEEWRRWSTWADKACDQSSLLEPPTPLTDGDSVRTADKLAQAMLALREVVEAARRYSEADREFQLHMRRPKHLRGRATGEAQKARRAARRDLLGQAAALDALAAKEGTP